jgi:hypothetical protein
MIKFFKFFNFFILFFGLSFGSLAFGIDLKPSDIAKRVASRAKNAIEESSWFHYKNFGTWNYEGALVYRGLYEIKSALADSLDFDIEPFLDQQLNFYQVIFFRISIAKRNKSEIRHQLHPPCIPCR